jgi:hypothetical protein
MGGFTAGIFSVAGMLVVVALVATLVKNGTGTAQTIGAVTGGFANDLIAAQGNVTSITPISN